MCPGVTDIWVRTQAGSVVFGAWACFLPVRVSPLPLLSIEDPFTGLRVPDILALGTHTLLSNGRFLALQAGLRLTSAPCVSVYASCCSHHIGMSRPSHTETSPDPPQPGELLCGFLCYWGWHGTCHHSVAENLHHGAHTLGS